MLRSGKKIVANVVDVEEIRVAILDDRGRLDDLYLERMLDRQRTGEIYKARVDSVLPGMHAAFLNLGDGRNGFLYLDDVRGVDVKQGMDMLVQVVKNARKGKGARVSPRVSLAGRYLVLVPGGHEIGVSKRIDDEEERMRLRTVARSIRPKKFGLIVRTVAEKCDEESLQRDVDELCAQWDKIESSAEKNPSPCLLYKDNGLIERILRDELTEDVTEIVVDSQDEYEHVAEFLKQFEGDLSVELSLYKGPIPLFDVYNIERGIEELQEKKVWLSSGAYLVIDQTEALTVVDVNTGKFTGSHGLRETVVQTNMEAAAEIARQLRLRAIGGIVVVDFIDMEVPEDKVRLSNQLQELFKGDRCKARVYGITGLGLVEITRKRARSDARALLSRGCPFCGGVGWVAKEETVAMNVKRFLRKVINSSRTEAFIVEVHPEIAKYIAKTYLASWEEEFSKAIFIKECPEFAWGRYRLDSQGTMEQVLHRINAMKKREAVTVVHRSPTA